MPLVLLFLSRPQGKEVPCSSLDNCLKKSPVLDLIFFSITEQQGQKWLLFALSKAFSSSFFVVSYFPQAHHLIQYDRRQPI
jgi:hypothetical protein